ncbi:MAG: hypothetical protein MJZ34_05200 [Paludibacteraceae bacterium]|nr:hypothetical protein [Paludibacteraceae bacterium]
MINYEGYNSWKYNLLKEFPGSLGERIELEELLKEFEKRNAITSKY